MKHRLIILVVSFSVALACFEVSSQTWLRLKLVKNDVKRQNYKNIGLFLKILRKEKALGASHDRLRSIMTQLTRVYVDAAEYRLSKARSYLKEDDFHSGLLDKVMIEYEKILDSDKDYRQALFVVGLPVEKMWEEILVETKTAKRNACIDFGEQYINKAQWKEAKSFFTKKILQYLNPAEALHMLDEVYSSKVKIDIKQKIWGDVIFVVLEDFEDSYKPVFYNWASSKYPKVKAHLITTEDARNGERSEYFDLFYPECGWTFWVKDVNIPLSNEASPLGLRFFVKSRKTEQVKLAMSVWYEGMQTNSTLTTKKRKEIFTGGWQKKWINDVYSKAKREAEQSGYDADDLVINEIIIIVGCDTEPFYIDDVELFLSSSKNRALGVFNK